jgi:hydrogenase-4 component F
MLEVVFCLPLAVGLIAFFLPANMGRVVLVAGALFQLQLALLAWLAPFEPLMPSYFGRAPVGMLVLVVTAFIFVFIAVYSVLYMRELEMGNEPMFIGSMLLFVGAMSMAAVAEHPIVFWIAVETTTLVSAPLIFLHHSKKALEATWKYVLICSVGIALALLGFFFITLAMEQAGIDVPLTFTALNQAAVRLDPLWLKTALCSCSSVSHQDGAGPSIPGCPTAHSDAPSPASACSPAPCSTAPFSHLQGAYPEVLAGRVSYPATADRFGLFSMPVAGISSYNQTDYKRMLAYSSIENMGISPLAWDRRIGVLAPCLIDHHSLLNPPLFASAMWCTASDQAVSAAAA